MRPAGRSHSWWRFLKTAATAPKMIRCPSSRQISGRRGGGRCCWKLRRPAGASESLPRRCGTGGLSAWGRCRRPRWRPSWAGASWKCWPPVGCLWACSWMLTGRRNGNLPAVLLRDGRAAGRTAGGRAVGEAGGRNRPGILRGVRGRSGRQGAGVSVDGRGRDGPCQGGRIGWIDERGGLMTDSGSVPVAQN